MPPANTVTKITIKTIGYILIPRCGLTARLKYVNMRRALPYLKEPINKRIEWAVFEPNGEPA